VQGKGGESAGAKSGGEIGEGQAEQMRQPMRRREEKGYLGQTRASLLGDFPICHWASWAFLGTRYSLYMVIPINFFKIMLV
jgi:hypothetical protein